MKKIPMILLALIFAASCGDSSNGGANKFNPETDWVDITVSNRWNGDNVETIYKPNPESERVEITVNNQLDIEGELLKLASRVFHENVDDCSTDDFLCVTPKEFGSETGPFFRNVIIKGSIKQMIFSTGLNYYDQIYNLDMSATELEEMVYSVIPVHAKWVVLPETLINLGAAFSDCKYLEEMVIPKNVTIVHDYNFEKLPSLKRVVVKAATPPELLFACEFEGATEERYPRIYPSSGWELTVPAGSKAAYEAHEWWGMFSSITEK